MSYRSIKIAVGLFVLSLVIAILSFSVFILKQKGVFEQKYNYHFYTESAQSFSVGMPLFLSGFQIGSIEDIRLTDTGQVHITFSISPKNQRWITQDTQLNLKKPFIGAPYIEVLSVAKNPILPSESELKMTVSDDIDDIIAKLEPTVNQLQTIIADLSTASSQLADPKGDLFLSLNNFEGITNNINTITKKIAKEKALITSLTGNPKDVETLSSSFVKAENAISELQSTVKYTNNLINNMNQGVIQPSNKILGQVDNIMKDVEKKLKTLDKAVEAIGSSDQDIYILRKQLLKSMEKTDQLIDKVDYLMQDNSKRELELP